MFFRYYFLSRERKYYLSGIIRYETVDQYVKTTALKGLTDHSTFNNEMNVIGGGALFGYQAITGNYAFDIQFGPQFKYTRNTNKEILYETLILDLPNRNQGLVIGFRFEFGLGYAF